MAIVERLLMMACRALWRPLPIDDLERVFDRYLMEIVRPALGVPGTARPPEPVGGGRVTLVRRWTVGDETLFARAWRYDRTVRPAREQVCARALLQAAGLRVPELVWIDEGWRTLRHYRLECAVERAAPGQPLTVWRAEPDFAGGAVAAMLADDLRRLHAARGPCWGKPWRPSNPMRRPGPYWLGQIRRWRRIVRAGGLALPALQIDRALERLAEAVRRLDWGAPRLVHGDLSPAHLFFEGEPPLVWIDFGTVHYGHPAEDLAVVKRWIGSDEAWAVFLDRYRAGAPADDGALARAIELFDELRLWVKLDSRIAKRMRHAHHPQRDERLRAEQARIERRLKERYLD